jgi:biopolymer transport protein ExbD
LIGFFIAFSLKYKPKPVKFANQNIYVSIIDKDKIIIQGDTTNYDNFASKLKKEISKVKKMKAMVQVNLPKNKKAGQFLELIQIVTAFENVELKLTANN